MDTIFTLNDEDLADKINLDELYERKQVTDLGKLEIFNKILNRIHTRIKTVSRQHIPEQYCWYIVPEMMIGVPRYNHGDCIAYLIDKLQTNGFNVRYTHPNLLFISWKHWVPSYVRSEIKKKTGMVVDGYGNLVDKNKDNTKDKANLSYHENDTNSLMFNNPSLKIENDSNKKDDYKQINSYKPTGNLIYNTALFKKIDDKLDR